MADATATALPAPPVAPRLPPAPDAALARRARLLSWFGLVWIGAEGAVAIAAGIAAGSVALIGFGIDSAIEGLASLVIIWRFTGARLLSSTSEQRAQRLVALQFFILAPYVGFEAAHALIEGARPEVSWLGIGLAATSAVGMPLLGLAKRRVGERLGSLATRGEGMQNVLCGVLALALLIGLVGNAAAGLWWLDSAVAFGIAAVAVREGMRSWRGDPCGCAV